jgi:polyphosphate kinase 2 (PPK2 family)
MDQLQTLLYADGDQSLLVVLQALDAAGKDGVIRHLFTGMNPQGTFVFGFKQPSKYGAAHDFLWRVHLRTHGRGEVVIFNRSHYEVGMKSRPPSIGLARQLPKITRRKRCKAKTK